MPDQSASAPSDPWEEQFTLHTAYPILMGGGRRKPALPVAGPAVIWHLGFWVPRDMALRRREWVEEIETFIRQLYSHLEHLAAKDPGFCPHTRSMQTSETGQRQLYLLDNIYHVEGRQFRKFKPITGQATRYQMFRVRFHYGAIPVTLSLELQDEFFTLSTSIDLAWQPEPKSVVNPESSDYVAIQNLNRAIGEFDVIAMRRYREAKEGRSESSKQRHREEFRIPYGEIYEEIWTAFYRDVFKEPYEAVQKTGKLGDVFANVRGFVATVAEETFISGPGKFVPERSAAQRVGTSVFDPADAVNRVDVLLPWLKADKGFSSEDNDKESDRTEPIEFTFTKLLGNRAILATALGAQLSRRRGRQAPMTYMILARNQARWQLGRLIERGHTLGTLRLAALYDFQHLLRAGLGLRELDIALDQWDATQLQGDRSDISARAERASQLFRLSQQLAREAQQIDADEKPQIAGGLAHRVERSRYYRLQFEHVAAGLRHERIEGFPTYPEAVTRRLGGIYELIDMIGNRFARLQEKLAAVNRQIRTTELLQLQQRITRQTTTIEDFQRVAEIGFFLVLFPYYMSHIVSEFMTEKLPREAWMKPAIVAGSFLLGFGLLNRGRMRRAGRQALRFLATYVFSSEKRSC